MKAVSNMKELLVQTIPGQSGRPAGKSRICFGTVNIGTISGRVNEEAINEEGIIPSISFGEVEIMLAEKWVSNVISVKRYHHRCFRTLCRV